MDADLIRHVLDTLDRDHVRGCADAARAEWDAGSSAFEVCYQPGDMTSYALVFTILTPGWVVLGAPGGGTGDREPHSGTGCPLDGSYALVTYCQRNASCWVERSAFTEPGWLDGYFKVGPASSLALAILFNEITGASPDWLDRYLERATEAAS